MADTMESKELEVETVTPTMKMEEEGGEETPDLKEPGEAIENVEYSYESHRSPFPEGEFSSPALWTLILNTHNRNSQICCS
jgi:hypothetical protein